MLADDRPDGWSRDQSELLFARHVSTEVGLAAGQQSSHILHRA